MDFLNLIFLFFVTTALSCATTYLILYFVKYKGIFDSPNKRSSHKTPTPTGGGLGVIAVILLVSLVILNGELSNYHWLLVATFFLGFISWIDDLNGLSATTRLLSQFVAVGSIVFLVPNSNLYFHGIFPFWLDKIIAMTLWVWFINLFNFMDGIDGITAVETTSIGIGVFTLMMFGAVQYIHGVLALVISASALGFLWWNWQPAKLFLGDVGSIALGFLLGWILLEILATPFWPVTIILPLYYLSDATITLIRRALKRKKIWKAHREHFYQQAVGNGLSHAHVSTIVAGVNVMLMGWAFLSLFFPILAIIGASICVTCVLFYMCKIK